MPAWPPMGVRVGCFGRGPPAYWPGGPPGPPGPLELRCGYPPGPPEGRRSKMGLPRWIPAPGARFPVPGRTGGKMGALYTGRGPVCGITMRRGGGAGATGVLERAAGAGLDSAAIEGIGVPVSGAGAGASSVVTAAGSIAAAAGAAETGTSAGLSTVGGAGAA